MATYTNKSVTVTPVIHVYTILASSSFELLCSLTSTVNSSYMDPTAKATDKITGYKFLWDAEASVLDNSAKLTTYASTIRTSTLDYTKAEHLSGQNYVFEDRCSVPDKWDAVMVTVRAGCTNTPITFDVHSVSCTIGTTRYVVTLARAMSYWFYSSTYKAASPPAPSGPPDVAFSIDGEKVTLSYSNVDANVRSIYFDVLWRNLIDNIIKKQSGTYKVDPTYGFGSIEIPISNHGAAVSFRARNANTIGGKIYYSDYSDTTEWYKTVPQDKAINTFNLTTVREDEVNVAWSCASNVSAYDGVVVQYAQTLAELTAESGATFHEETFEEYTESGSNHQVRISGLETGVIWYFRIRAFVTDSDGTKYSHWWWNWGNGKDWDAKSVTLGTVPDIPTTWCLISSFGYESESSSFPVYAIHNCEDGSACSYFQVEMSAYKRNGTQIGVTKTKTIENKKDQYGEYSKDNLVYNIAPYSEWPYGDLSNGYVRWRIRTKGVLDEYGPWSALRNVNTYVNPSLSISTSGTFWATYPIQVSADMTTSSQEAISFFFDIKANRDYSYSNPLGEYTYVTAGQIVHTVTIGPKNVSGYSGNKHTEFTINPTDVHLEPGIGYSVYGTVYTDAGLSATAHTSFTMDTTSGTDCYPGIGEFYSDPVDRSMYIQPVCYADNYSETLANPSDYIISVYRLNADSTYTLISENQNSTAYNMIHDPHPRLDSQIYKIVAVDKRYGRISVSSEDLVLNSFSQKGLVIQWDDQYGSVYSSEFDGFLERYIGKFLFLPFNVDVSESITVDKTLVSYIGREDPVSYYGTAKGKSYTIKTEIPKYNVADFDSVTALSLLRELSRYTGNVYVRTFSGVGCWATIDIDFNIDHCALTIPINFKVTPVEGGV